MPRYFFNLRDGGSYDDDVGHVLADDQAVRLEAMRTLPEIARDKIPKEDDDRQGFVVLVTDENGKPVYSGTLTYAGVWLR